MAEPALVETRSDSTRPGLANVRSMLDGLDEAGVRFCHWKSNEHLLAGLLGETDLDLLVQGDRADTFHQIASANGYLRVNNPSLRRIEGLEDYVGVDGDTGSMSHLHVHYRLVLGERHVKDHHLPLEDWLLAGCVRSLGVPIPQPEQELVLLYLRSVLKSDAITSAHARLRGIRQVVPPGIRREIQHLLARTDTPRAVEALYDSGLPLDAAQFRDFLARASRDGLTGGYLLARKRDLRRRLRPYLRHQRVQAALRRAGFRVRFDARVQRRWPVAHKTLSGQGLYIAVVGADGSGKSRLVSDLKPWLGRKLEVSVVYFGQPKHDRQLIAIRRLRKLLTRRGAFSGAADTLDAFAWVYIARGRYRADATARRRCGGSQIVVAERFPHAAFTDMPAPMDGPRLQHASGNGLIRWLAKREARYYDLIGPADLTLALHASLATLRDRKPDTDADEHAAKYRGMVALSGAREVVVIDAERPYADVLLAAQREIWNELVRRARQP